ncbi:MAG: pantoate--beta-alanine ligase [Saprospiraceae bacterium]|nr:pantoate--beta-alanine ligase [Saprospiraceae bacterium]
MNIINTIADIKSALILEKEKNKTIGFVPTMGALHDGHLSLIQKAKQDNDIVVCSIFVNPIQFNNKEDLEKYPRVITNDIKLLQNNDCDYLFNPSVDEMYPKPDDTIFDFGHLDKVMEGNSRPGHFNGVAIVVKKLFEIIEPHKAYFGEKDFQQLLIIKKLTEICKLNVEIIPYPIIREKDGLAMSSRNLRLSKHGREIAPNIFKVLAEAKTLKNKLSVLEMKEFVNKKINNFQEMEIEYFEIANAETLLPIKDWHDSKIAIGCIVVNIDEIRLIDNVIF